MEYMQLVNKLNYDEKPDYNKIRTIFEAGLKQAGCKDDGKSVHLPTGKSPRKVSRLKSDRQFKWQLTVALIVIDSLLIL